MDRPQRPVLPPSAPAAQVTGRSAGRVERPARAARAERSERSNTRTERPSRAERPPRAERPEREPGAASAGALSWVREFRFSGSAIAAVVVLVVALVSLAPSLRTLVQQRQEIAQLEASVAQAQTDVDALGAEIDRWSDPAYIEAQARDRLFYVYPGDQSYLLIGGADLASGSDGQPISDQIQTTRIDWLGGLLSAVYRAGLTDASPDELGADPATTTGG
ncbi:MAG: septum formation initiator family protein [Actinomycetales bacterium]|nr:septum formation initiator family protein [Actinomycetales bacterium]